MRNAKCGVERRERAGGREWKTGMSNVECRMKNEELPPKPGPLPISSFFILHSTFDISGPVSDAHTAYLDEVCAKPVITYDPDFASFLILIRFAFWASSSRSLKVS